MNDSLRGHLLVAGPGLVDPNFRRTVVLVGEHNEEGALGLVLNRPSATPVREAAPPLAGLVGPDEAVWVGGPVQPEAIVVLGEFEEVSKAATLVVDSVGFLPDEVDPDAIGTLHRARVFAGYAGWGAGQLDAELAEESWITAPATPDDVFWDGKDDLWAIVLRRKGGPYELLASMPPDPSLN